MKGPETIDRLRLAADAAQDKKAEGLEVLDLRELSSFTDYFLICHGSSPRQVHAIVEEIDKRLRAIRVRPQHVEGTSGDAWVLMDYLDFVVHVFTGERRAFYGLEKLWADAPRVELGPPEPSARATS